MGVDGEGRESAGIGTGLKDKSQFIKLSIMGLFQRSSFQINHQTEWQSFLQRSKTKLKKRWLICSLTLTMEIKEHVEPAEEGLRWCTAADLKISSIPFFVWLTTASPYQFQQTNKYGNEQGNGIEIYLPLRQTDLLTWHKPVHGKPSWSKLTRTGEHHCWYM